jgi:hypothetical protein
MLDPLWDLDKNFEIILRSFLYHNGLKKKKMWGRFYVRPAVKLGQLEQML